MENRQPKVSNIAPDGPAYSIMAITSVFGIHWKIEQLAETAGQGPNRHFCAVFDQDRITDEDALRDVLAPQGAAVSLPPRAVVLEMVSRYFKSVNRLFPIYNEEAFVTLVKHELSPQGCRNSALWTSLNVMLALALDSESRACESQAIAAHRYFHNAQCTLPSMLMLQGDLLSIQALLITVRSACSHLPCFANPILTHERFTGSLPAIASQCTLSGPPGHSRSPLMPPAGSSPRSLRFWCVRRSERKPGTCLLGCLRTGPKVGSSSPRALKGTKLSTILAWLCLLARHPRKVIRISE